MEKTLTVAQTAQRLGCTLKYVYDLLHEGRLQAKKVEKTWRIPVAVVEARLKARKANDGTTRM